MKYLLFILLLFISSSPAFCQDENTLNSEANTLLQQKQYAEAIQKFEACVRLNPLRGDYNGQISYCQLMLGDLDKAEQQVNLALNKDITSLSAHANKAYVELARGKIESAKSYLATAFFLCGSNNYQSAFIDDFNAIKSKNVQAALCDQLIAWIPGAYATRGTAVTSFNEQFGKGMQELTNNNLSGALQAFQAADNILQQFPAQQQYLTPVLRGRMGEKLFYSNDWKESKSYFEKSWAVVKNYSAKLPALSMFVIAYDLANYFETAEEYEKASSVINIALTNYSLPQGTEYPKAMMLLLACRNASVLQQNNSLKQFASQLLQLDGGAYDAYFKANANNFLGNAYVQSSVSTDRQKAKASYEEALRIATANNFADLIPGVKANLALTYWQSGDRDKAQRTYQELATYYKQEKNWVAAEEALNNLGSMQFYVKNYAAAARTLREAIAMIEEARSTLDPVQRLQLMQRVQSTYAFLATALAKAGDAAGTFTVQNQQRSRVLEESMNAGQTPPSATIESFQKMLAPDEAAIFYSLMEAGIVSINVVTRNSTHVVVKEDFARFVNLKARFLDRINASNAKPGYRPVSNAVKSREIPLTEDVLADQINTDDFNSIVDITRELLQEPIAERAPLRNRFLRDFYDFLITPISSDIANAKKLIIFPDGILNFVPFEALMSPENHYLVENFDVRYAQSASVFQIVNNRSYPDTRKSFLGMGGAIYERMAEKDKAVSPLTPELYLDFQLKAEQNASSGQSQREIYASLFSSDKMNYLQGTRVEVENLRKIFPSGTVFVANEMTENHIKGMSKNGELAQYKIIHLATHGFALSEIPVLSGVAMCIPTNLQNGEDGYLTAPEIAKLNINADLVTLSACETALGKIHGGEGVVGLTGSLLQAGANEVYVSLWPVNDAGTMYFMTGMYELVVKQGKSYAEAGTIMKRKFIAGEFGDEFKLPDYWAPFVHYGK